MEKPEKVIRQLARDMEHVSKDVEHFLSDLKGRRAVKGRVKEDTQILNEHLYRLIAHLEHLEGSLS